MEEILIGYINEVYCSVSASKSVMKEFSDLATFWVPGFRFMEKYKSGLWDGRIKLIRENDKKILIGLMPLVEKHCKEYNYNLTYDEKITFNKKEDVSDYDLISFISKLDLCILDKKSNDIVNITPRDYQLKCVREALVNKRNVFVAGTNTGKTLICYMLIRYLLNIGYKKILLVVPRVDLVRQSFNDFSEYSFNNLWDVEENVAEIYSGKDKFTNKSVYISTYQSLIPITKSNDKELYFNQFDVVIIDEVHQADNYSLNNILTLCVNAKIRVGMTGTLKDNNKVSNITIQSLLGEPCNIITAKQSIERGESTPVKINCYLLKHNMIQFVDYKNEIEYIQNHEGRNKFILKLISKIKGNVLVVFHNIKHGKDLHDKIKETIKNRKIFMYYGEVSGKDRAIIKEEIEKSSDCIIFATDQTFSTGLNIKSLNDLILVHPYKSNITICQSIGRMIRKSVDKDIVNIHDVGDDFTDNTTMKHFKERVKTYKKNGFPYEIHKIGGKPKVQGLENI